MRLLTPKELKAALWLLPLLIAGCYVAWRASYPTVSDEQIATLEAVVDTLAERHPELREFDPNTVEFFDLCRMGFTRSEALSIIKYRERGKVFEIPEDFASCYAVDESTYNVLRPYIRIGSEYALKPHAKQSDSKPIRNAHTRRTHNPIEMFEFMPDTAGIATFVRLGFSTRQAEVIINYRTECGGFHSAEEFERCYVVSESAAIRLRPYAVYAPRPATEVHSKVDINTADSATLCSVVGIGPASAAAIIEYRQRLGGYHSVEQLAEIPQVTERNFERILSQIWCDSCKIQKIDINFAPAKELMRHPYLAPKQVRKLLKERQLKGGWCTREDFNCNKILDQELKAKLAPYLIFRCETNNQTEF
ncbi:MAG: helix-hairpin-helix domain-containing protein [Rikenellaceae bacterium]|nr:helix-hairpin-helix domain-containing protein [Rikenellaceae bacterium]